MKTILVPTDFSMAAVNATEYAINLAKDIGGRVVLIHVYNIPLMPYTEVPVVFPMPQELHQDAERQLEMQVKNFKKNAGDIEVTCKAIMGLPVAEIEQLGKDADFIVMGMRDAGKLSELLIGSVTTAVIKTAETPVFVIPEHATYRKPTKIVLATDYSLKTSSSSFEPLKRLVQLFNSKLFIVKIKTEEEELAEYSIAETKMEEKFADVEPLYYFPQREDLVDGINGFVTTKQANLLAIVPHKYNWLEGLFHRRNSKRIVFHTDIPLLTLPETR